MMNSRADHFAAQTHKDAPINHNRKSRKGKRKRKSDKKVAKTQNHPKTELEMHRNIHIKCLYKRNMKRTLPPALLTLEAVSQVPAPEHPGVEAERVPVLRAEEALRGDLQRVQRQPTGALRVRPGLLEHHVRPGRVQSPSPAPLEAGAEDSGSGCRVQGLREPERRGPDGLIPGAAAAAAAVRLLPDQRLYGEAFLVIAVLEHFKHLKMS